MVYNGNKNFNNDNKIDIEDAVYLIGWINYPYLEFYNIDWYGEICRHDLVKVEAVKPTCTEAGNSEYWHCTKCGKYFADADGNKEITIESTIVEAKGHSYSTVWSFDTEYHWHDASCGCDDAGTIDKAKHIVDKDGHCACGYSAENNYTVQYYWENIDDSGYTLHETVSGYAPVGSVVNAEIKKYEHFNAVDSSVSATIDSIDITVLKVYYRRDVYTITFDPNGGRLFGTAVQKVKYGGNAVLPEFERDPDDNFFYEIDRYDGIYENVQGDATVTVIWKSRRMNELSAPSNVAIDNDTVSWSAVENAASYIVTAGDYSFETKSTSCALSRLKNAAGETIVDYGTIDVTVTAVGKSGYKNATSSAIQNFYVPETKGADYDELYKWNIGHGYNLIENEYLKLNEFRSNLAVFNLGKLMTIGTADINSKNNQTTYDAYSFSSVDDYMSQLNIDFNTSASVGANASFWKFKAAATLKTALGLSMSTTLKEYNNTQIIFYNFYVSQGIKSIKFKESDEKLLKYSLSNTFVKDIMRRSNATKDYVTNEQLAEYIYKTYGTHAILGVTTGGILSSTYVAATNKAELAAKLKESSSVDSSAEAGGSYAGATASVNAALGVSQSAEIETGIKHEDSYVKSTISTYGGKPKVKLSNNPKDAISLDNWELDDNTGMPMAVYNGMAYDISYLIGLYDAGFAQYYAEYVDSLANDEFRTLTKQFERKNSIPTDMATENGKSILTIDLSAYQNSGLKDAYSPNLIGNTLTVYPTYCGKYVDKVVIKGGFNDADKHNLFQMTVKLAESWVRDVEVCFENCGLICEKEKPLLDLSGVNANVSTCYSGFNLISNSEEKEYYIHAVNNGKSYNFVINLNGDEEIDYSACGVSGENVIIPILKGNNAFDGWNDCNGNKVASSNGTVDASYSAAEITSLTVRYRSCFESIDETPWQPGGTVVTIDWTKEENTDLLQHTDRCISENQKNEGQFDCINIDGGSGIEEVIFKGDPSKIYYNLVIKLCNFEEGQKLTIRFVDFKFTTRNKDGAILANDKIALTIDVAGDCSISSTAVLGKGIGLSNANLTISGSGTLTVKGGKGADGTNYGENGTAGGTGIVANRIEVGENVSLTVHGGNGGNGHSNKNDNWQSNSLRYGGHGGDAGGAIECDSIIVKGILNAHGGSGGNGGYGYKSRNNAGVGGNGGNGGFGIKYSGEVSLGDNTSVYGGVGGAGGDAQQWNAWGGDQKVGSAGATGEKLVKC